jgi:hypothetical protein
MPHSILHRNRIVLNDWEVEAELTMSYRQTNSRTHKFHSSTKTMTIEDKINETHEALYNNR